MKPGDIVVCVSNHYTIGITWPRFLYGITFTNG